jgi:hypothetical protein
MRILGLLFSATTCIAGEFINLTFDDPDLSGPLTEAYPGGPLLGKTSQLLRGWNLLADDQSVGIASYSPFGFPGGDGIASLVGNSPAEAQTVFGANTLYLASPGFTSTDGPVIRLRQTGTVPAEAQGLWIFGTGRLQMLINGERVNNIGNVADPVVDISRYAGQTIDLEFVVSRRDSMRFDILGFKPIPEPSTWTLGGIGAAAVFYFARRKN